MELKQLIDEIQELEGLIEDYKVEGFRVNEYLYAKLEMLKTQLAQTK
jgi:hypothetical protein